MLLVVCCVEDCAWTSNSVKWTFGTKSLFFNWYLILHVVMLACSLLAWIFVYNVNLSRTIIDMLQFLCWLPWFYVYFFTETACTSTVKNLPHWTTYHRCHRQLVPELFPLLVHKRGISYLHQSVKWTVSQRSSAI